MPIPASSKGGSDFEPIPAGSHQAVCYGVVDLGTQPSTNPAYPDSRKVCILWELPQERSLFPDKNDPSKKVEKPRAISNIYTLSLSVKANLRKVLESWRAKPFTDEEAQSFDVSRLIGANCMLSVIHKPGTGQNVGKVYANVSAVSALPKGMAKAELENAKLYFSFFDIPAGQPVTFPDNMPDWLKAKITQSEEYIENERTVSGHEPAGAPAGGGEADDDNISF
jgi:hypothetical protein